MAGKFEWRHVANYADGCVFAIRSRISDNFADSMSDTSTP
jgi:hypothetical protein